jgi:hypothetical protein
MTLRPFLRNLQTRKAFIAAFTSEKRLITIKKSLFHHWPLIMNFLVAYFLILVRCKTKGAVGAVCASIRVSFETSFDSKQPKLEPKLVSALSETKHLFRLFRFYIETASFGVSIEPKQTEDQPQQTETNGNESIN